MTKITSFIISKAEGDEAVDDNQELDLEVEISAMNDAPLKSVENDSTSIVVENGAASESGENGASSKSNDNDASSKGAENDASSKSVENDASSKNVADDESSKSVTPTEIDDDVPDLEEVNQTELPGGDLKAATDVNDVKIDVDTDATNVDVAGDE